MLTVLLAGCGRISFSPIPQHDAAIDVAIDSNLAGLVAWFGFEDQATDVAIDLTGNQLTATCISASCPTVAAGHLGAAREFDGTQTLQLPRSPLLETTAGFTVDLWARYSGGVTVLAKPQQQGVGASYELFMSATLVSFCTDGDPGPGGEQCHSAPFANAGWHHYAITWDGSVKRTHVDGNELLAVAAPTVFDMTQVVVGSDAEDGAPSTPFVGALDEVRIYNRALSLEELRTLP